MTLRGILKPVQDGSQGGPCACPRRSTMLPSSRVHSRDSGPAITSLSSGMDVGCEYRFPKGNLIFTGYCSCGVSFYIWRPDIHLLSSGLNLLFFLSVYGVFGVQTAVAMHAGGGKQTLARLDPGPHVALLRVGHAGWGGHAAEVHGAYPFVG